ncbi:GNAT family N-acetyltransferase [Vibrio marisflavi]|uniref:N-acetyltransferase domain-containing protein n=1 Tax=Vibrio marisflavi CECT 7928 TaxID=634439 RepID=A0ABM9A2Z2_9VIBR|nr:N-acetyltransferase [Vibrio marisflavi]CAH0538784.1 hypothetical protein VMF7928_01664 [Vibrio marisflavi CECT 7928]
MLIRAESLGDILAIDKLLKSTFDTEAEADLVMRLRENGHLTLSLVASTDDGEVIGHVMFSPVLVQEQDLGWQGLAPVSVREDYRNQGIAAKLIQEGFASLREFGYPVCVVLGDPKYYARFGFESAQQHDFHSQWELPEGIFQITDLVEGASKDHHGLIRYCPEFDQV